jgi:hypothetical protein
VKPYRARSTARLIVFVAVLGVALIAIVARLAQVQLVQGETFASAARANQIQLIPISAPRGLIVDRNGVVMVRSRPSFVCALIPSEVVHIDDTLHQLATVLHIDEAKLRHRLYHHLGVNYENFDQVQTYEPNGPVATSRPPKPHNSRRANRRSPASTSKSNRCATIRWARPARKSSATSVRSRKTSTARARTKAIRPTTSSEKTASSKPTTRGYAGGSAGSRSK